MKRTTRVFGAAICALCTVVAAAEVRLPNALSDHAVLQRDRPVHIWGWATPAARLTAHLHDQTVTAEADELGRWSLYLRPEKAGGPYVLSIAGDGAVKEIGDLLMGDVWFASGQSNMEMPLEGFPPGAFVKDAEKEIAGADHPEIRLLRASHKSSDIPLNDVDGASVWKRCTPETTRQFSAVAYFFGRAIAGEQKVPVGLIDSTWGGTPADSWISLNAIGASPELLPAITSRAIFAEGQADLEARIAAEKREDDAAKLAGKPAPSHPWHPSELSWSPAGLYNGMIAPFTPMTIKGFLWYQGETNSSHDRAAYYGTLFRALIGDWRSHFAQGDLPFLYVQISSFSSPGEDWGTVRDQQRRVLSVAHTAMAVTLDVGQADNVHPPDKQTVGARLALAARDVAYGETIAYQGPVFREATTEQHADSGNAIRVWFDHAKGLSAKGGPELLFEVAGADHRFLPAASSIEGETVLVRSAQVPHPVYVRYGWAGVITSNLVNAQGLPASTFTSEEKPLQ